MKPDYKNWMPKGMIWSFAAAFAVFLAALCGVRLLAEGTLRTELTVLFAVLAAVFCGLTVWAILMYRAFSYDGKRQMSKQIIEGIADYVTLPEGGRGLDVGCGSGVLAIACAKRNPQADFLGIDRWGKEYASFSKPLCERNAAAEGVHNVRFARGDATKLELPDESFDAVVSNYVYHNIPGDRQALLLESLRVLKKGGVFAIHDIFSKSKYGDMQAFLRKLKGMGYEDVQLIDTTDGKFISKGEAAWMALAGSALLTGRK